MNDRPLRYLIKQRRSSFSFHPKVTNFPSDNPDLYITNSNGKYPEKSKHAIAMSLGSKRSTGSKASILQPVFPWQYTTQGYFL